MQAMRPILAQQQHLKMNPQMLQSIKLMELPIAELRERIEQELERNPALELVEDKSTVTLDVTKTNPGAKYELFETSSDPGRRGQKASEDHMRFIEGVLTRPETLQEHILKQLQLVPSASVIDEELRVMAETLVQNLDDDGFHKEKPYTLFANTQRINEAVKIVQGLDPIGCCTKDYRESLAVQIELSGEKIEIPDIEILLDNLELVEREKYNALSKKLKLDEEDTQDLCDFIKTLSPFPGRAFASSHSETRYVIPDIKVTRDNNELVINLNDEAFPVLGINPNFEKFGESNDQAAREFARKNINEARLFINHLSQRSQTLIRVANAILEFQRAFFINGPKHLAPLTLGDIARELDVHETTVSRTANGKYMQTEWGIFEIRYFFTNSISGAGSSGSQFSKESVKEIIKEIIIAENRILSDKEISSILSGKGIALARRTVAKYRKELDMGSSYNRKLSARQD
ncbi:MAG: RNA polymerase factor sigma-54 [Treponema sp.]|nr:RNA polymerase factor sigma-54 [Treponema sp.]MCL2236907.1 RNA polymerase factor sigma-54 [Treponema sp.]